MTKGKPNQIVFPLLALALCLSLVAVLAPPLSSPVRAGPAQDLGVDIIFPVGTAPVTVTPRDRVEVSAEITVASTDYYIVSTTIMDSTVDPPVIIGRNTQLTRLFPGDRLFNSKVSMALGVPGSEYDVIVTADLAVDFDPATSPSDTEEGAVIVGNIQEPSFANQLIGKSTIIVGELILKSVSMVGALFDRYEALSDKDRNVVNSIAGSFTDRLAETDEPDILDGVLGIMADMADFLNSKVPLVP